MTWQCALLFPDPEHGWAWAEEPLVGLPSFIRVLATLKRSGIQRVLIPPARDATTLRNLAAGFGNKKDLPELRWLDQVEIPALPADQAVLAVRGGVIFSTQLIHWFDTSQTVQGGGRHGARLKNEDNIVALMSLVPAELQKLLEEGVAFNHPGLGDHGAMLDIPSNIFCQTVQRLTQPGGDRELLATVGKPTDRRHVVEVRSRSFPLIRWAAVRGTTPNQITWAGFLVALFACFLIARGNYWSGIVGAVLLYGSWMLDCMDGTLARLTFAESPFGQKLDTLLGHVTNLCIFSALIWSVYGHESLWKAGIFAFFILGGIMMAYRVTEERTRLRPAGVHPGHQKLQKFLDKINHRDYAVLVFILAVLNGFKLFLWLSVVGVQIYWLLYLWLIMKQRGGPKPA